MSLDSLLHVYLLFVILFSLSAYNILETILGTITVNTTNRVYILVQKKQNNNN